MVLDAFRVNAGGGIINAELEEKCVHEFVRAASASFRPFGVSSIGLYGAVSRSPSRCNRAMVRLTVTCESPNLRAR